MQTDSVAMLFDLDGTLISSSRDLAVAANRMLDGLDLPRVPDQSVEGWIGDGVRQLVRRCITGGPDAQAPECMVDRGLEIFRREYLDGGFRNTELLPGCVPVLEAFGIAGFPCALVTNKPLVPTLAILEKFRLMEHFTSIVCGNTLSVAKPNPEPLLHALRGCEASSGWMVGDSVTDSSASVAAGLPFIAVRGGYGPESDPERFPHIPNMLLDGLEDLLEPDGRPLEILSRPPVVSE